MTRGQPAPVEPVGVRRTAAAGGWSLTLTPTSSGRPADWAVVEARLAAELKGGRRETIERTIGEVTEAHVNTTVHLYKTVQRGLKRYRAINGVSPVSLGRSHGKLDPWA